MGEGFIYPHLGMESVVQLLAQARSVRRKLGIEKNDESWDLVDRTLVDVLVQQVENEGPSPKRAKKTEETEPSTEPSEENFDPDKVVARILQRIKIPRRDITRLHPDCVNYIFQHLVRQTMMVPTEATYIMHFLTYGDIKVEAHPLTNDTGLQELRKDFSKQEFDPYVISILENYRNLLRGRKKKVVPAVQAMPPTTQQTPIFQDPTPLANAPTH